MSPDSGFRPGSGLISRKYGTPSRMRKSARATSRQPRPAKTASASASTARVTSGGSFAGAS